MLDLSNNNATGHNFKLAYIKGGQRRVYLKICQGTHYTDPTYTALRRAAQAAGFKVGAYDFLEPLSASPAAAAAYLIKLLPKKFNRAHDLRPCLDVEMGTPSAGVGKWVKEVAKLVEKKVGVKPLIYGGGYFLADCHFSAAPGPLWLAAYGRNDGREYPVDKMPFPWKKMAAHQYSSKAHVIGINGPVDISHIFSAVSIDLPKSFAV